MGWINKRKASISPLKNQSCHIDFISSDVLRENVLDIKLLDFSGYESSKGIISDKTIGE